MAYYNWRLVLFLALASLSFASNVQEGRHKRFEERLDNLEVIVARQDAVNSQQAELITKLQLKTLQQEEAIKRQSDTIRRQFDTVDILGKTIRKQEDTIKGLEYSVKSLPESVYEQEERGHRQDERIRLHDQTLEMLNRIKGIRHGAQFPENISNTSRRNNDEPNRLAPQIQRGARQYERIAFSSYLDHTVQNPGIDQPIVYNKIVLNEGSAYNEHSGIFTCPMDGIYGFYFSIATVNVNQIVAKLVVDSVNEVDGVADTFHTNHEAQGGNFVLVTLTKGQQVWVANYRWATHVMQESDGYRFSTFSGFLLN